MIKKLLPTIIFIIIIVVLAVIIDLPSGPNLKLGSWQKEIKVHLGLDLQGGSHLVYKLDDSKLNGKDKEDAANAVVNVIDKRVNSLGVSESNVQLAKIGGQYNVVVELPGITNIDQAINLIGKTAQLTFWEMSSQIDLKTSQENSLASGWNQTALNGAHLKKATVKFDQTSGKPYIGIDFNSDGTKIFADLTKKNLQKPLAIVLDNQIISAPIVQSEIDSGQAVITGSFTLEEARNLAKLLNAGALPVPIELAEQRSIDATLGINSVEKSIVACVIGVIIVSLFMIIIYRIPGLIATVALCIYGLITLALFKLIPVTLTLAGITGFIISFGMAVDANILIFARMKEEFRKGAPAGTAVEDGFKRAWPSIFDSNISSLITCLILYSLTTGLVKGFSVTLALGIIVSMFTAVTVTKTFLRLFINSKLEKYLKL